MARSDHWRWVSTPRWSRTSRPFDRLRSDFDLPTPDVPGEDLQRLTRGIGAQQRLRIEAAQGIAQQNPADRHDGQPGMAPHGGSGAELDEAITFAVPARYAHALPARCRRREHVSEVGQAPALGRWAPLALAAALRCRFVKSGIQAQPGHADHALARQGRQQLQRREAAIGD